MGLLEILLLAIGLSFDTFAVSLSSGICLPQIPRVQFIKITLTFAIFQSGLTLIGWIMGSGVIDYIGPYDHWIAFILLSYIGGKMIYEGISYEESCDCVDLRDNRRLITVSLATSIDALAVGISLALINLDISNILIASLVIAAITALASTIGLKGGRRLGKLFGKRSEIVGGIILIIIGSKILIEHLGILF